MSEHWEVGDYAILVCPSVIQCEADGYRVRHFGHDNPKDNKPRQVVDIKRETAPCGCVVLYFGDGTLGVQQRFHKVQLRQDEEFDFRKLLRKVDA